MARTRSGGGTSAEGVRITRARTVVAASVLIAALAFGIARASQNPTRYRLPSGSSLVFSEEFSGPSLDEDRWAVETPWHTRYATGELQWYEPEAISFLPGGVMRIATQRRSAHGEDGRHYDYTSAMISTGSREDRGGTTRAAFRYGYFEMRARLPKGRGVFPAFWLTNDRTSEIDVVEMLGHDPRKVYLTLRHLRSEPEIQQREYSGPDFSAGYHTYAVDWQPAYVRFYVDGVLRAEFTEHVPSDPMWVVVNTAVGGEWPGDPDPFTRFPQYFDVDYVRVWRTAPR